MTTHILLIENDLNSAKLIRNALKQSPQPYSLSHVELLEDGLTISQHQAIDIVLINLSLPDSFGIEAVEKYQKAHTDLPVIVLTDHENEHLAKLAVREGALDYLLKEHINTHLLPRIIYHCICHSQKSLALRTAEERHALSVAGARDGIWDWDFVNNTMYYSTRWKAMLGYRDEDIGSDPDEWFNRIHPEDLEQLKADIDAHNHGKTAYFENEHRIQTWDSSYRWVHVRGISAKDKSGNTTRIAGSQTDITERRMASEKLLHDTLHDTLTGLPNRLYLMRLLPRSIERSLIKNKYQFALLVLDIDRYKIINDSLGHVIGDQLLTSFASRLKECIRPGDVLIRLGGDEFTIFLDHVSGVSGATRVAERILESLKASFHVDGHELFLSTSIGIVLSSDDYEAPEDMLRDADIAMYQAKLKGKARYEIFNDKMRTDAVEQHALETDLRRAIERDDIDVFYQPIVSLNNGHITGFEALARWQRNGDFVPPHQFIATAEETGLIIPIGEHVLNTACKQMGLWIKRGLISKDMTMSVNLSSKQFLQTDLVEKIVGIIARNNIKGHQLRLEITESIFLECSDHVTETLDKIKALGIKLSMDDFGTGYASLSSLHRLPIDILKVDRSFISGGFSKKDNNLEMVRTIVAMAHNLGMSVVAEGVETHDLLDTLQEFQCESAQGYYFSPAVDQIKAGHMLANTPRWECAIH
ncbi:MAG: EAL domain-containing protein [Gammaproteobacteria bacterium]